MQKLKFIEFIFDLFDEKYFLHATEERKRNISVALKTTWNETAAANKDNYNNVA